MSSLYIKGQMIPRFNMRSIVFDLWTFKITLAAIIIPQLAEVIKMIVHLGSAFFAEATFFDLIDGFIKYFFADAICHIGIAAFHGYIGGKSVIGNDNDLHVRRHLHGIRYQIHGNIDLSVPIQLIPKEIRQHHKIRFKMGKDPKSRGLIHFNAGIICIQCAIPFCRKYKRSNTAVQHV